MGIRKAEVLERLRDYIDTVAPFVGDKLPAERQLAADISCSRETLRAALAVLQAEGELWRHVGQGTFRGARYDPAGSNHAVGPHGSTGTFGTPGIGDRGSAACGRRSGVAKPTC